MAAGEAALKNVNKRKKSKKPFKDNLKKRNERRIKRDEKKECKRRKKGKE
jgi:hypothetical protein